MKIEKPMELKVTFKILRVFKRHMIKPYIGITKFFRESLGEFKKCVDDVFDKTIPSDNLIPVSGIHKDKKKIAMEPPPEISSKLKEIWETIRKDIQKVGIEAIAFYAPYHTYGLNYGIYFYEDRLLSFVNHLQSSLPQRTFYEIFCAVFRFILKHELFHFKIELVSTISERILQRQLYRYIPRDTEENLAQAYAFRARIQPDIKRALEKFFLSIPMYKNFKMYNDPTMRENALKNILPGSYFLYLLKIL